MGGFGQYDKKLIPLSDTDVRHEGSEQMNGVKAILYALAFLAFLAAGYYLAPKFFHLFTTLDEKFPDKTVLALIGALGTLFGGISLYFLREHKRILYALLEIAFAIVAGGTAIGKAKSQGDLGVWIALAASAYLIVRGMENLHKGGFTNLDRCNHFLSERLFARQKSEDASTVMLSEEEESKSSTEA